VTAGNSGERQENLVPRRKRFRDRASGESQDAKDRTGLKYRLVVALGITGLLRPVRADYTEPPDLHFIRFRRDVVLLDHARWVNCGVPFDFAVRRW
jgi:hypothetical protein